MELMRRSTPLLAFAALLFIAAKAAQALDDATATSTGWWQEAGPHLAIDGDWRTLYAGTGEGNTLDIVFEAPRRVESIAIGFHPQTYHRPRSYQVELRLADGSWTPAAHANEIPPELALHALDAPVTATGLRMVATQLSASGDVGIREVFVNRKPWVSTTSLDLPRPALSHNSAVHVQPFDARLKFYHHGDGLLYYTQGQFNRVDAVLVVSPLAADADWFTSTYGMGRHRFSAPFTAEQALVAVELDGPAGRHRLESRQQPDAVVLRDTFTHDPVSDSNIRTAGLVFRLPVDFWAGGRWKIADHAGDLAPVAKATGDLATMEDITIVPLQAQGGKVAIELQSADGRGALHLEVDAAQLKEIRCVRRSGFTGHFIDLYAIPRKQRREARGPDSYDWQWRLRFDESLPRPWWASLGHSSRAAVEGLVATDPSVVASNAPGSSGHPRGQILDPQSPFYGAVPDTTGDRNGLIEAMPLHTRNHVIQLARRYRNTADAADLPAIMAGLDYLAATVAPWGQFGDIRVGGWVEAPFFWDIVGVAEAIEIARPHADAQRLAFWLAGIHRQYQAVAQGTRHRLRFKDDIGPNMVTFAVQLLRMARYFRDETGGALAADAMSFALAINPSPFGGLQSDFSYSHGNPFDTGYYRWLLDQSFGWHNLTRGTAWELTGEDRAHWQAMQDAFQWLLDNGQLNTMTSHPKNRLIETDLRALRPHGPEALWGPAAQRADYREAHGNDALTRFVADDSALPTGQRYFDVAGMFVERTAERYLSFWWNADARVRDDASGPNVNYNTKVPLGAFYLRQRRRPRELTIPSDNLHYSGASFVQGMEDPDDWATGFENFAGSRLSAPIAIGQTTVFIADVVLRAKRAPDAAARFLMTTLVAPDELVRVTTAPPQPAASPVTFQPLVIRASNHEAPSLDSLAWEPLAGSLTYAWSLSDQELDGSQRYASIPAARVWRLRSEWPTTQPLVTAWRLAGDHPSNWRIETATAAQQHCRHTDGTRLIVLSDMGLLDGLLQSYPAAHIIVNTQPDELPGRHVKPVGTFWHIHPRAEQ